MVALGSTASDDRVIADYDDDADVLYFSLGEPVPSESEDDPAGIVLRWSIQSGQPSGATVVGYRGYSWSRRLPDLISLVAHHLHVSAKETEQAIKKVTTSPRMLR
jgi:hypothetical protein